MRLLELFCGTKSIGKVFEKHGWEVTSVDFDPQFEPSICADIRYLDIVEDLAYRYDFIWASPPCTTFSVASIGKHWNKDHTPKTQAAEEGYLILERAVEIIELFNAPFVLENPRGKMRRMPILDAYNRYTVAYCQYGDFRQKPTDLWSNMELDLKPMCQRGSSCHAAAPRGSKTGTQGMGTKIDKGVIPEELCEDIYRNVMEYYDKLDNKTGSNVPIGK